mmetsp:Transcript_31905/g.74649  ORF Transcript_31905/g.74649 Transcript_31905/m.74649 type:complete len:996 (+) Transcript_31905:175-3162(+)
MFRAYKGMPRFRLFNPCIWMFGAIGYVLGNLLFHAFYPDTFTDTLHPDEQRVVPPPRPDVPSGIQGKVGPSSAGSLRSASGQSAQSSLLPRRMVNVAFIYSEGGYRDGLEAALRSACLSDSQLNVSMHVLVLPQDEPGAAALQLDWDRSGMPCPLYTFTYENERFSWETKILPKVREHYANMYNFVQHIDLPAILGRRGVEMALVIDTDVLFLGEDPIRVPVERCYTALASKPEAVLCSAKSKNGWGMGALIIQTKKYAALDFDFKMYQFAEEQRKIQGTKPLMNGFFAAYPQDVIAEVPAVQKNPGERPCNEGIAHWATGAKPWKTKQTSRYCPKEGSDCSKFALCKWWLYKNNEVDVPSDRVLLPPVPEVKPLVPLPTPKRERSNRIPDRDMPLHIAFAQVNDETKLVIEASTRAVCLATIKDAPQVVIHVMHVPMGKSETIVTGLQKYWERAQLPCKLETFGVSSSKVDWRRMPMGEADEDEDDDTDKRLLKATLKYWQFVSLPSELGRRGVKVAMLLDPEVFVLSTGLLPTSIRTCWSWLEDTPEGLACLPKSSSWMDGASVVDTSKFAAQNLDFEIFNFTLGGNEGFNDPTHNTPEHVVSDFFRRRQEVVTRACLLPALRIRDPNAKPWREATVIPCNQGLVRFAPSQKPWRLKTAERTCPRDDCNKFAQCQYFAHRSIKEPQSGKTDQAMMDTLEKAFTKTQGGDPDHIVSGPKCSLRWMSSKLHLFTMTPSTDWDLMRHFLMHYRNVGVDLTKRATIVVHRFNNESMKKMLPVLREFQVFNYSVVDHYDSGQKRKSANNFIKNLPEDAWLIYPDNDEFFEYPCAVETLIKAGSTEFFGEMTERLGPGLTLPPLKEEPKLLDQYPIACPYRRKFMKGGWASKYMLIKAWVDDEPRRYKDSHRLHGLNTGGNASKKWGVGHFLGGFPHFYFIGAGACDKLNFKQTIYTRGVPGSIYRRAGEIINCTSGTPQLTEQGIRKMHELCDADDHC